MSTHPHMILAVTTVSASASAVSWATDHAVWFTIGAGVAAILSGAGGFAFYCVATYYKIKNKGKGDLE